ncbi:MAG: LptF/LptG family permease [Planctomycetota bacterium]
MKLIYILQTYLIKELAKTLFLALIVITSILFMGVLLQLVGHLSVIDIGSFINFLPSLLFYLLGYTLPLAMLASTTLTFGKFSSDNEITAMKACGVSPVCLITPVILFSLLISLFSYYLNDQIIPQSNLQKRQLLNQAIESLINSSIAQEGSTIEVSNEFRISYFKFEDGIFYGLVIHRIDDNLAQEKLIAQEGKLEFDQKTLRFELKNGSLTKYDRKYEHHKKQAILGQEGLEQPAPEKNSSAQNVLGRDYATFSRFSLPIKVDQKTPEERANRPKYRTITQLTVQDLYLGEERLRSAEQALASFYSDPPKHLPSHQKKNQENNLQNALKNAKKHYHLILLEIHQRIAFSLSSLFWVFVAIGVSLLQQHRVFAFGLSAILVMSIYYPLIMVGESLTLKGYPPLISMWIANLVTGALGGVLIWKAFRR